MKDKPTQVNKTPTVEALIDEFRQRGGTIDPSRRHAMSIAVCDFARDMETALRNVRSVLRVADRSQAWRAERDRSIAMIEEVLNMDRSTPDSVNAGSISK